MPLKYECYCFNFDLNFSPATLNNLMPISDKIAAVFCKTVNCQETIFTKVSNVCIDQSCLLYWVLLNFNKSHYYTKLSYFTLTAISSCCLGHG